MTRDREGETEPTSSETVVQWFPAQTLLSLPLYLVERMPALAGNM